MVQETDAFEVKGDGEVAVSGGVRVVKGGITIESGGQVIESGGLRIDSGGLEITQGDLSIRDGLVLEDGGLKVQDSSSTKASLLVGSTNPNFSGSLVEIDVSRQSSRGSTKFRLVEATDKSPQDKIFSIDSDGDLVTRGDIATSHHGRIISSGALISQSQTVFLHEKIVAGEEIVIPNGFSYVQIVSDGVTRANLARISTDNAMAGQLLVVQNEDEQSLMGELNVKPQSAAIYVFDGSRWKALTAASFDTTKLIGVKEFQPANDLNLGEVKVTAKSVQVGGQKAGFVALYGKGGELGHADTLKFDSTTRTLQVDRLEARVVRGKIDMSESELRGVEIVGGHISGVNMAASLLEVNGELFVGSNAYFGAGITVDGQVMGSGAYVDSSDERFKKDIVHIANASQLLQQIEGVEYSLRVDEFPSKKFSAERQLGFLAQQLESVLPQVVATDDAGFKYVAYNRLVPVVVEAFKDQQKQLKDQQDTISQQQQQVDLLTDQVAHQQDQLQRLQRKMELLLDETRSATEATTMKE